MVTLQRRRGADLEQAILDAAWDELTEVGYAQVTMEGVAARARTGKQVLYRRWSNRVTLVHAAVRQHLRPISADLPDTGSLRGDMLAVMRRLVKRFEALGPDLVNGMLAELGELPPDILHGFEQTMLTILQRGVGRGEVRPDAVTKRIAMLPTDLVRHDLLLRYRAVTAKNMNEIVDDIFLPLVRPLDRR